MHNGAKIGMIVLLVLAVVLGASGVTGLVLEGRERAAQPTEYQMYQSELEEITQECEGYQAIAEQSLINIQGYIDQMEKNRAAVAAAGGSTADVDKALETVKKALSDAESTRDKIVSNVEKVKAFAGIAESDAAGVANARNMMPKRRNSIVIDLKKITKIDADESASNPSFETIARKQCETATAAIQAANPDVELGEQFVVTKEAAEAADEVMADRGSLTEYLKKNWQYCNTKELISINGAAHVLIQGTDNCAVSRYCNTGSIRCLPIINNLKTKCMIRGSSSRNTHDNTIDRPCTGAVDRKDDDCPKNKCQQQRDHHHMRLAG